MELEQTQQKRQQIAHFVYIPFTNVGIFDFKSQEWFDYRIKLFKEYTLKSLLAQSNRNFTLWLSFRQQEYNNQSVIELGKYLKEVKMPTIMTFDGLMYYDDKFSTGLKERFLNIARVMRQSWRDKEITQLFKIPAIFTNKKNKTLLARLESSLKGIATTGNPEAIDWVYMTRIDSDDMFHRDMINEIQKNSPFEGALVCKKGYVYNSFTNEMAEWNPPTNPPFHTIIFPSKVFFDAAYHKQYYRNFKSHEDVIKIFVTKPLPDYMYCVLIHSKHISTIWNHPFKGQSVNSSELDNFLLPEYENSFRRFDGHKFSMESDNQAVKEILEDFKYHKSYEPETSKIIKRVVKPEDIVVDCGASIGYFTLLLARQAKKVYAFEPTPNQFTILEKNVILNGYKNVELFNKAVSDTNESIKIHCNADFQGKEMETVVLDNILPEKIDFIKIDVDGSEPKALKGLIKTFERNPQLKMVIEYSPPCMNELGNDPKEMMAILDKYFTYERIQGEHTDDYYNLYCVRKI